MPDERKNCIVVLGPTASGKTALGVRIARALGGEILSADSRQVYRGLDIGSGKDLDEYVLDGKPVPYHLIDLVDLDHEFSVFEYQTRFFDVLQDVLSRDALPVVVGGTGLYLEAVLKGYEMADAPENPALRHELARLDEVELEARLRSVKTDLHNVTDLGDRGRMVRAIEIAEHSRTHEPGPTPDLWALILGTRWDRAELHRRIEERLRARMDGGLIKEVEGLMKHGVSAERLRLLGLEYRYVTEYLEGAIRNRNDLFQKLNAAIRNFAKRQETWFRRMERNGMAIEWIPNGDVDTALRLAREAFPERA